MKKIYSKITIDIDTDKTLAIESYDYEGPVVETKGAKVQYGKPAYSVSSQIINDPSIRTPLTGAINQDIVTNPFLAPASREYQMTTDALRSGYGARGLANSGIAIQGEQGALSDIALKAQGQRAAQLTGLLGTASSSPSFPGGTSPTPRGFMGLK